MAAERIAILGDHGSELNSVSSEAETEASIGESTQSSVSVAEPEYGIEQLTNAAFRAELESRIRRAIPLAGLALRLTPERPGLASTNVDLSRWNFPARLAPLVTLPPHTVHLHQRKIPCADCGQLTVFRCDLARLHWSGGTYLYGNHPVNRRRSIPYGKWRIRRVRTHGILPSLSAPEVVLPLLPSVCLVHFCCVVAASY